MKCGYDNLEDAQGKLNGTYCLYGGKAFSVKKVWSVNDLNVPGGVDYWVAGAYMMTGKSVECSINDPKFNCADYNIGYVNRGSAAAWFYRMPLKQYKQGLRYDQVGMKASNRNFQIVDFKPGKAVAAMLENDYPKFQAAVRMLRDMDATIVAFHRNFAMTYDRVHEDFILEYKGENIGYTTNLEEFKLLNQHGHLYESLKEAVGA